MNIAPCGQKLCQFIYEDPYTIHHIETKDVSTYTETKVENKNKVRVYII